LSSLTNPDGTPDYDTFKVRLESFILQYPQSEWTRGAQGLLQTINKISTLQNKARLERLALEKTNADKAKLLKEIDLLKTEAIKLQHENDQLRNDLAILKRLEIQLEKREKLLK